jgi:hypothetical protein
MFAICFNAIVVYTIKWWFGLTFEQAVLSALATWVCLYDGRIVYRNISR